MLLTITWTVLAVGIACSVAVVVDNFILGYRQPVRVMGLVWPVTALYGGPAAVVAYWKWGRPQSHRWRQRHGHPPSRERWGTLLVQLCHGGTHCALGTIIAEAAIFAIGIDVAGGKRWVEYLCAYSAAVAVGLAFRYSAEAQRSRKGMRTATRAFVRADLAGVSAFEFALFVWLALADDVILPAASRPSNPVFWLFLQIGLILGLMASWPTALWLARHGLSVESPDAIE